MPGDDTDDMKWFVLLEIYGENETNCAEARAAKWRKMKKKSLAHLRLDEDTLHHYSDRVNYLSFLLKHYELNCHPSQIRRGWEYINGKCRSIRYAIPATADVFQQQPQALSDDYDDDGSDGEYGANSDDCDTKSLSN